MLIVMRSTGGRHMTDRLLATCLGLGIAVGGCDQLGDLLGGQQKLCTLIGCSDSFNATVKPRAGEFPAGTHEVIITVDGAPTRTCTFEFPFPGTFQTATCTGSDGLTVMVSPMMDCRTLTQGDAVSQTCTPSPGKFQERLSIPGLPANVRITQRLAGGATYLERHATPGYQEVFPNGKDCGAVCKQAAADWDF
jgi:hypothetical protein